MEISVESATFAYHGNVSANCINDTSMTTNRPIKCAAKGFKNEAFYLIQYNGADKRIVASFQNKEDIKLFLKTFIESVEININVKITDLDDYDDPQEFKGVVAKEKMKSTLDDNDDFLFHDGYHELTIMNPNSNDLIEFDEHGLIFIYANTDYSKILENFGLKLKSKEKLIYEYDHWHYRPADGQNVLKKIISDLNLKQHNWH